MALHAMIRGKITRAFVGTDNGEVIGVVTLQDICREIILQDAKIRFFDAEEQKKAETVKKSSGISNPIISALTEIEM